MGELVAVGDNLDVYDDVVKTELYFFCKCNRRHLRSNVVIMLP